MTTDKLAIFSTAKVVKVSMEQIYELKQIASSNVHKKHCRLCLHESPESQHQDMFICCEYMDYIVPHMHDKIEESHTIIEGTKLVIIFNYNGEPEDAFLLDRKNGYLSVRINPGVYHMDITLSEYSFDYETRVGPFRANDVIFAKWAPALADSEAIKRYINNLLYETRCFYEL